MSLKCHFDADGWLQGPVSITHMTSPNHYSSGFADKARGLVQHTEDGFTAGTVATFMSEASQVSAFFGVSESGAAQQFLPVGHGYVAWAEGAGNPDWRSCECEDMTKTGQPMTQAQMVAFAQILEACSEYDGFPLQITDDVNGTGLITHGDGGVAWGDHPDCPGDVRKAQRPQIIALAASIRAGGTPAPPAKAATVPSVIEWTTEGQLSLAALAKAHGTEPSTILRMTAERSPGAIFEPAAASYVNEVFGRDSEPMPPELKLFLPG